MNKTPHSLRILILNLLITLGCGTETPAPKEALPSSTEQSIEEGWFREVSREVGIDFVHQDGRSGERFYVETSASGGGWLDGDGDGDLDLYLINGAATPGSRLESTPRNALYENRDGTFVDVTEAAGVGDTSYGMGLCAGDYDADGHLDFFVTNYGADRLFRHLGTDDGQMRFAEVAEAVGVAGESWGTNCAFADLDGDGDLDLYVANYVDFRFDDNPRCGDAARGISSYCRPAIFRGQTDFLYINQGREAGFTFTEEGERRGILRGAEEKGYGVLISDIDGDGDGDILVANDGTPNRLYVNDGRGFFTERSLVSGLAVDRDGQAESGMGMDLGDADGDGRLDLLVTNYAFETNTLYLNRGELFFEDRTAEAGLGEASYLSVGWGVGLFDVDNDGDLDAAVANGHVMDNAEVFDAAVTYAQPNLLFENDAEGRFSDVSSRAGSAFTTARVSRALAVGDWNDDGRLDLMVTNTNDTIDLFENTIANDHHWVGFELHGPPANPSAIGTRVVLYHEGEILGVREIRSGGSFLAQGDLRAHFGLGTFSGPFEVHIDWPDGRRQKEVIDRVDAYLRLDYNPR